MYLCVFVCFLTTFSWIWQLETEILMETSSVDEIQTVKAAGKLL